MAFNFAHDVALPTSAGEPVGFLIYPQAETTDGRLDSLDPDSFKYEINSRAVSYTHLDVYKRQLQLQTQSYQS